MIVCGLVLVGITYSLFVAPVKSVIVSTKLVEAAMNKPRSIKIVDREGNILEFPSEPFTDENGEVQCDFLVGKVRTSTGEVREVVLKRSEVELMQLSSYLKAEKPSGPLVVDRICDLIQAIPDEVAKDRTRQVKRR
jgi:hypothetical protein